MRDYGKVHTSFWASPNVRALSEDGRTLAMYLLTCPHGTIAGVFRLPDGYASEDLQWDAKRVREGFAELLKNGFANRCETTKWVWVVKHLEWNPPENPNQRKSAAKVAMQIPDGCAWKADFMRVCGESLGVELAPQSNGSETVPKPLANQEQEQEQEQEVNLSRGTHPPQPAELLPAAADASAPREKPAQESALQAACRETWQAYGEAYMQSYGVAPVRNARVNAQVKQLVQRLGAEAPHVAAWFVSHPGAYYFTKGHDIGALLADAEKLRTEWATGRVITAGKARQSDRAGTTMAALAEVLAEQGGAL